MRAEKGREQQKLQQDWIEQRNAQAVVEQQKVLELIPSWRDPARRDRDQEDMVAFALKAGFQMEQLQNVMSATELSVLYKAMQYEKLQARATSAKPVVQGKPAAQSVAPSKPKAVPRVGPPPVETQYKKDRATLRQTGRIEDATKVFLHYIDD